MEGETDDAVALPMVEETLEVHGLDRCPDQGIDGFKRYVALAVVERNIQQVGALLQKKEETAHKRQGKKAP